MDKSHMKAVNKNNVNLEGHLRSRLGQIGRELVNSKTCFKKHYDSQIWSLQTTGS